MQTIYAPSPRARLGLASAFGGRAWLLLAIAAAFHMTAQAAVFTANVAPTSFTLYKDPTTGQEIKLGGFSGLFPVPGDLSGRLFYTVTDRGPNADHPNGADKVFPRPDYAPSLVMLRLNGDLQVPGIGGNTTILEVTPMRKPNGALATGLPNPCLPDSEKGFDVFLNPIAGDSDGLDVEGLSMDAQGNFWISDEYRPSVAMVSPSGVVLKRLVPKGSLCGDEVIDTVDVLPKVLAKRRANRGLEGVAAASNGRVYAIMQRPLMNPTRAAGNVSRNLRIVEIDAAGVLGGATENVVRQFLYVTEITSSQANTYASDIFPMGGTVFLVTERFTDKLYAVDLSQATDITSYEDENGNLVVPVGTKTTLEQLTPEELASIGIQTAAKLEVLPSLIALDPALDKCEGLAFSAGNIVLCPDNDFNLTGGLDDTTSPASLILQEPTNREKVITTPFPQF